MRSLIMLQLQEIFRKKNEKKNRKGDAEKSAQLVRRFNLPAPFYVNKVFDLNSGVLTFFIYVDRDQYAH